MCLLHQFLQPCSLVLWVGVAPVGTVVRVILWAIHIDVQLVAAVELKLAQAVLVAPGVAVEAFDDASAIYAGPVLDAALHDVLLLPQLQEGLHTIVGAGTVPACDDHAARLHAQQIALGMGRHLLAVCLHSLVAHLTDEQAHGTLGRWGETAVELLAQESHGVGIGLVGSFDIYRGAVGKGHLAPRGLLRQWRQGGLLGTYTGEGRCEGGRNQ